MQESCRRRNEATYALGVVVAGFDEPAKTGPPAGPAIAAASATAGEVAPAAACESAPAAR